MKKEKQIKGGKKVEINSGCFELRKPNGKDSTPLLFDSPIIPDSPRPTLSFINHFVKPETPPVLKSKYDYLSLYNKVCKLPFFHSTEISLIIPDHNNKSIYESAVSILKYFIESHIFYPHDIEFSSDYKKIRVLCAFNYGGDYIRNSWKYTEPVYKLNQK